MYLRLGWVVGNAGLLGAIAIILLAHVITITTGLSVSSMATNIRVGAGGAFSIISQSLGLEVGGSVSVPLLLAQAISTALYVFAFTEGWLSIFPAHSATLVVFASLAIVFIIAYISASLTFRIQFIILTIVVFSLIAIFLGSFPSERQEGMIYTPVLIGNFPDGNFWTIFAVFFPAVTGIMAGISLSGMLKNPRRSLPVGTMSAILLAMVFYLALIYWLSTVASPAELLKNPMVMADHAFFRPTFSISRLIPLIGMVGCFLVMFLVNAAFSVVSIALALLLYIVLNRRQLQAPWQDVRSGLFFSLATWAVKQVSQMPPAPERTWSPNLLAPVRSTRALQGSYRLLLAIAAPKGSVHALGLYKSGSRAQVENLASLLKAFREDDISGLCTLILPMPLWKS